MKLANCIIDGIERTAIETVRGIELLPKGCGDAVSVAMSGVIPTSDETVDPAAASFLLPVHDSAKFLCVGLNYKDHAAEAAVAAAGEHPSLFVRFRDSIVAHGEPILAPVNSVKFDFEGELAIIIGKEARHVSEAHALDHVIGYSCFAENSVRDFQSHSRQITPGKNFPKSGALGPWLATADEVDPGNLLLTTRLNGTVVQQASTGDLVFGVAALVSYISSFTVLRPGDVIATGTPSGVGALRQPPLWMKPGDTLEIDISGVGRLINPVIAESGA